MWHGSRTFLYVSDWGEGRELLSGLSLVGRTARGGKSAEFEILPDAVRECCGRHDHSWKVSACRALLESLWLECRDTVKWRCNLYRRNSIEYIAYLRKHSLGGKFFARYYSGRSVKRSSWRIGTAQVFDTTINKNHSLDNPILSSFLLHPHTGGPL